MHMAQCHLQQNRRIALQQQAKTMDEISQYNGIYLLPKRRRIVIQKWRMD